MKYGFTLLLLAFSLVAMPVVAADLVSVDGLELCQVESEAKFEIGEEVIIGMAGGENAAAYAAGSIEQRAVAVDIDSLPTRALIYSPMAHGIRKSMTESPRAGVLLDAALG